MSRKRLCLELTFVTMVVMGKGPATAAEVGELLERARDVFGRLEPDVVGLHEVPAVFDAAVSMERLASGAVTRLTARYEESGAWKRNGAKSAEDDVADKTGTSKGRAKRTLSTSKRLGRQPGTDAALRQGELSPEQADEVSSGAEASPEDEDALLESARRDRLHELRRKAAEARARADKDREARRRRQRKQRCLRRWKDDDGMGTLLLKLPDEDMAEVDAAMKPHIERAFARGRDAGRYETWEQYGADAAKELLTGGGAEKARSNQAVRPDKKVIAVIDVPALNRGRVEGDETCVIAGVGPVSVSAVRSLLSDAFLAVVFKDGVDVLNVTHPGRQVTATQRTALEARGCRCERCGSRYLLDIEHNEGWTLTHETRVEDLSWACGHCHDLKTYNGLRFVGPPGDKRLVTEDGRPWDPVVDAPSAGPPPRGPAPGGEASSTGARPGAPPGTGGAVQRDLFGLAH